MIRATLGVLVGIVSAITLTVLLPETLGSEVVRYTSLLMGGGLAGFISRKKGWLFGGIVGIVVSATVAAILIDIALESSGGRVGPTAEMQLLRLGVTATITGALGGFIGQQLQRRFIGVETK